MKKILFVLLLLSIFCVGCEKESIYNYRGSVVVDKWHGKRHYFLRLRDSIKGVYYIKEIDVTEFEYSLVELGDTIK